jgi:hypothetical protein
MKNRATGIPGYGDYGDAAPIKLCPPTPIKNDEERSTHLITRNKFIGAIIPHPNTPAINEFLNFI